MNSIPKSYSFYIGLAALLFLPACVQQNEKTETIVITSNPVLQDSKRVYDFLDDYLFCNTNAIGVNGFLEANVVMTVVDVRDAASYKKGHIPTAINIPFNKYDSFEGDDIEFPGLKKDRYTYVYCYEEFCNLAHRAAKKFASLGYPVKIIRGGFDSWKERGYPIEK